MKRFPSNSSQRSSSNKTISISAKPVWILPDHDACHDVKFVANQAELAETLTSSKDLNRKSCRSGCTMSDLCADDKNKISDLLRKVIHLTEDNQRAWKELQLEQKARADLANQNRELVLELASLKTKLSHSLEILRAYQVRARDMQHFLSKCSIPGQALFETSPYSSSFENASKENDASSCETLVASGSSLTVPANGQQDFGVASGGPNPLSSSATQCPSPHSPQACSSTRTSLVTMPSLEPQPCLAQPSAPAPALSSSRLADSPRPARLCIRRDQGTQPSPMPLSDAELFRRPFNSGIAPVCCGALQARGAQRHERDKENAPPHGPPGAAQDVARLADFCTLAHRGIQARQPAQAGASQRHIGAPPSPAATASDACATPATRALHPASSRPCGGVLSPREAMSLAAAALPLLRPRRPHPAQGAGLLDLPSPAR